MDYAAVAAFVVASVIGVAAGLTLVTIAPKHIFARTEFVRSRGPWIGAGGVFAGAGIAFAILLPLARLTLAIPVIAALGVAAVLLVAVRPLGTTQRLESLQAHARGLRVYLLLTLAPLLLLPLALLSLGVDVTPNLAATVALSGLPFAVVMAALFVLAFPPALLLDWAGARVAERLGAAPADPSRLRTSLGSVTDAALALGLPDTPHLWVVAASRVNAIIVGSRQRPFVLITDAFAEGLSAEEQTAALAYLLVSKRPSILGEAPQDCLAADIQAAHAVGSPSALLGALTKTEARTATLRVSSVLMLLSGAREFARTRHNPDTASMTWRIEMMRQLVEETGGGPARLSGHR